MYIMYLSMKIKTIHLIVLNKKKNEITFVFKKMDEIYFLNIGSFLESEKNKYNTIKLLHQTYLEIKINYLDLFQSEPFSEKKFILFFSLRTNTVIAFIRPCILSQHRVTPNLEMSPFFSVDIKLMNIGIMAFLVGLENFEVSLLYIN